MIHQEPDAWKLARPVLRGGKPVACLPITTAGGYTFKSYWQDAWVKMNFAWQRMKPERYQWVE